MGSKRIIITLPEEDKQWLEGYSRAYRISVAESIRQGIKRLKESETQGTYDTLVQNTRGVWKKGDGLKYQERIRAEWKNDD
jgi:6-phosphogluconate dehydrogenase